MSSISRILAEPASSISAWLSDPAVRAVIEARIAERLAAKKAHWQGAPSDRVELCKRVADVPVGKQLGMQHWWLRGPRFESGMGPATGGVPGKHLDYPGMPTTINDHSGEGDNKEASCAPAGQENNHWAHEDQSCLERAMAIGNKSGRWLPWNQCHSIVKDALERCSISDPPDAHEKAQSR